MHKLTIFLDKDGVINDGLDWAPHTEELLKLLTYNDDIQVYWATVWFWRKKPMKKIKDYNPKCKTLQEFYYWYYIDGEIDRAKKYGKYMPWEEFKEKTKDFYKVVDDFYKKCKWHEMREKKTTILEVLNYGEHCIWIEDGVMRDELEDLNNQKNCEYIYVNLEKNPNQLKDICVMIKDKLHQIKSETRFK